MKVITQDGRTLMLNRDYHHECNAGVLFHADGLTFSYIVLREIVKDQLGETVAVPVHDQDVGIFENSHAHKVCRAFYAALNADCDFTVSQPTPDELNIINRYRAMEDFLKRHPLTQATPEETAIGLTGYKRIDAINQAIDSDYWEQRGVLIYHDGQDLFQSFNKYLKYHSA